jgi:hypothetical protein
VSRQAAAAVTMPPHLSVLVGQAPQRVAVR